ncbi:MAG: hypothetical protein ACJAWW_001149 [Sulfurimonas sp.]|jgi:hypothetical protein
MSEPTLESIDDYDTLKGEKKKVIVTLIIAGLIIGAIYAVITNFYSGVETTSEDKTYKIVPMK